MVNFKEIYHFSRFQRGPTFSRGGGGGGGGGGTKFQGLLLINAGVMVLVLQCSKILICI